MISNKIKLMIVASMFGASSAFAGIALSPHDLSGTANSGVVGTDDNGELCVYCHTPHAANTDFTGAPLWNKETTVGLTYTMYAETVAKTAQAAAPSNSSLACLSCHDGVSAIDSIVNAPGSGMGTLDSGTVNIVNGVTTAYGGNIGGTPGTATTGSVIDLSNDHPVSIVYTENLAGLRAKTTNFVTDLGQTAWLGATTIQNLLRAGDKIECGSCHDPHNGGNTQGTSLEVNFLRHTNEGSALCLGCHNK